MDHNKNNRTITGSWGGETISRPKTIGERHHMNSKHKALEHSASGKIILKKPRMLTEAERKEKTKNWPKGHTPEPNHSHYQKAIGRAYSE